MHALLAGLILGLCWSQAAADVFKWVDENGQVHYGDRPGHGAAPPAPLQLDRANIAAPYTAPDVAANEVQLYSTRWCAICKRAKAFLDRRGVAYREFDIESDPAAYRVFKRLGGRGVPLLVIGSRRLQGFDQSRLERALAAAGM